VGSAATVAMPTIGDGEWDKRDKLAFEREMLGLYVSDHPLAGLEQVLQNAADTSIASLTEEGSVLDGQVVTLAGILTGVQRRITKQGRAWASATLEDLAGGVEVAFFPKPPHRSSRPERSSEEDAGHRPSLIGSVRHALAELPGESWLPRLLQRYPY